MASPIVLRSSSCESSTITVASAWRLWSTPHSVVCGRCELERLIEERWRRQVTTTQQTGGQVLGYATRRPAWHYIE